MRPEYILWLGSTYDNPENYDNPAVSPAASHWQSRLIDAVMAVGIDVVLMSHQHHRSWPRGPVYAKRGKAGRVGHSQIWCGYVNIPGIKALTIARSLRREIIRFIDQGRRPKAVISYNPTREHIAVGRFVNERFGIPWVDLCADANSPGDHWDSYPSGAELATGHVFLSHGAYVNCPYQHKLHLDGGIDLVNFPGPDKRSADRHTVLYSGMLGPWGGVDALIRALQRSERPNIQLWICGHGEQSPVLRGATARDPRVRFFGQVPETKLESLMQQANILVNPRPSSINGGEMNFPSKLLRYLAYGKPVVSTSTPGLAPEYADVLVLVEPDSELALMEGIDMVTRWTEDDLERYRERTRAFAEGSRNWTLQAKRLVNWLDKL